MKWQTLFLYIILLPLQVLAWKMEANSISVNNTTGDVVTHIAFRQTYDATPLVFTLMDDRGSDPASFRVNNITKTGFDIYTVEPDGEDGPHAKMTSIPYIAIEPGEHTFPDGTKILAQAINTQKFQSKLLSGDSWETVSLSGFTTTPVVLGQIQTRVNERIDQNVPDAVSQPWITTVIKDVSSTEFKIALERSETTSGSLTADESIAYLVMDSGLNGGNHYFGSSDAIKIEYETIRSSDFIRGWDDGDYQIDFAKTYHDPIVVATKNTRDGVDGGWLRRGDIDDSYITLQVDEDQAADEERSHTTERAGIILFSDPFDVDFLPNSDARMLINEVMYNETTGGNDSSNDEFVELYTTVSGDIEGYILSDQDTNFYHFPSCSVSAGDYVIFHTGGDPVNNSCSGSIKHFYGGKSSMWNNTKDDVLLLRTSDTDVTTTTQESSPKTFNAIPQDYMAYGSSGDAVDTIPTSMHGVTLSWDESYISELENAEDGISVALTPNANDGNTAACWEFTASGNAADNSCSGYLSTRDTNNDAGQTNSVTVSNTGMPDMSIMKTSIVLNDPVNGSSVPKRIPGATIRYCFTVDNTGDGDAENATISDSLTGSGKDNLTYIQSGSLVQDIAVACDCAAISMTNGTISGDDVTIVIGDINGTNDTSHSRGCAYIQTTID